MLNKDVLNKSTQIELALPDGGFSKDFTDAISTICSEYECVYQGYLLVKKLGDDISILFGFLLLEDTREIDTVMEKIMGDILGLFSDDIVFEGVCLNTNEQLRSAMESITEPFYIKL